MRDDREAYDYWVQGDDDDAKREGLGGREWVRERERKSASEADESAMPPDVEWVDMNKQRNDGENKDGGGSGIEGGGGMGCLAKGQQKANKTSGTWEWRPE